MSSILALFSGSFHASWLATRRVVLLSTVSTICGRPQHKLLGLLRVARVLKTLKLPKIPPKILKSLKSLKQHSRWGGFDPGLGDGRPADQLTVPLVGQSNQRAP